MYCFIVSDGVAEFSAIVLPGKPYCAGKDLRYNACSSDPS